jgi:hypothetical protein
MSLMHRGLWGVKMNRVLLVIFLCPPAHTLYQQLVIKCLRQPPSSVPLATSFINPSASWLSFLHQFPPASFINSLGSFLYQFPWRLPSSIVLYIVFLPASAFFHHLRHLPLSPLLNQALKDC